MSVEINLTCQGSSVSNLLRDIAKLIEDYGKQRVILVVSLKFLAKDP